MGGASQTVLHVACHGRFVSEADGESGRGVERGRGGLGLRCGRGLLMADRLASRKVQILTQLLVRQYKY